MLYEKIDIDFSLAIHNRTGKYFIGRDIIDLLGDRLGRVYYGPASLRHPPSGLFGRLLGRIQLWQTISRTSSSWLRLPGRRQHGPPLLHLDPFTIPMSQLRPCDAVLCHDLGPITDPELFEPRICAAYRAIYRRVADVGPHVVFVSKASRDAFFGLFPDARLSSSRVIYPALRVEIAGPARQPADLDGPFLLTVGSLGARKNQARCIAAFARSGLAEQGIRYVLCGGPEPGFEDVMQLASRVKGVTILPYVCDEELAWLYRHAEGFILASLLEGFGIPVAEAIAQGLVPIVSRNSVLEEVAGAGAITVDPLDESDIASAMVRLLSMAESEYGRRLLDLRIAINRFRGEIFCSSWSGFFDNVLRDADR